MEDQLVSLKVAKLAKEKGFDEVVDYFYNSLYPKGVENINCLKHSDGDNGGFISLPSQSLLQRWLREKYFIHVEVWLDNIDMDRWYWYEYRISREMSFDEDSNLTLPFSDYGDGRWRVIVDQELYKYDVNHNTYPKTLEAGLRTALKELKNK